MATEKIKFNRNTLREQTQSLRLYEEFLPTLELRKQQLQLEVRGVEQQLAEVQQRRTGLFAAAAPQAPLLAATFARVRPLVQLQQVLIREGNVAGVKVPIFQGARFVAVPYSLLGSSPFVDEALAFWQQALLLRLEGDVLREERELIQAQLDKTTQRINLYEKVLIPEARANIRRINVVLGDRQVAAVCRAKLAKAKLASHAAAPAPGAGSQPWPS
ncbi:MAG: V-type ATP synthase subunit D [Myxococcota bacterium]|nr:V-type ATP synthase subunit D [Myxococcota bacterium]